MKKLLLLILLVYITEGKAQCSISVNSATICLGQQTATLTASGASSYTWMPGGINTATLAVSPNTTTTYTVIGNTGACTDSNTTMVVVNPLPMPTATSNTPCANQQGLTFNAMPANLASYNWSGPNSYADVGQNPSVSVSNVTTALDGIYTVNVTDGNGCNNAAIVSVTVNPLPIVTAAGSTVCAGQTINLSATGGVSYSWSGQGGTFTFSLQNPSIPNATSSMAGNYFVTATDINGCIGSNVALVVVNPLPIITYTLVQDVVPYTWDIYSSITGGTTPFTYNWNWGDGSLNASTTLPSHTYSVAGTYSICETIADANGCIATYCQNDAVFRDANGNNSTYSNMINVNVLGGGVPVYQKLLADSVTEFDAVSVCAITLQQQNGAQKTLSNCVNVQAYFPGTAWYAKGDSLYNSKTYKKVSYLNAFQGLMREDTLAKKVYFIQYCNTYEELLYNFSLNEGDTITYNLQSFNSSMTSGVFTVDSVRVKHDYTTYYHKHFYLKNHTVANNNTLEIIEGVGNVSHPLFLYYHFNPDLYGTFPSCSAANYDEGLSCKWNNGVKVYTDSCLAHEASMHGGGGNINTCNYCWGSTGGIEKYEELEQVTISPNPNNGSFFIETNATTKQTVQIYDVNGRIVLTQFINSKATIDASVLPSGIYNVSIINNEGFVNKRVVINH